MRIVADVRYYNGVQINYPALTEIRERSGFSKSEFALAAAISRSYLTEIEKGRKTGVSPAVIRRMSEVLKCPITALIRGPEQAEAAS